MVGFYSPSTRFRLYQVVLAKMLLVWTGMAIFSLLIDKHPSCQLKGWGEGGGGMAVERFFSYLGQVRYSSILTYNRTNVQGYSIL